MFDFDWLDVDDWMIIGPLSEELAEDERDRLRQQKEDDWDQDDED